jgi:predicted lipoprotein
MQRSRRTTWLIGSGVVLGLVILFWLAPPFHIIWNASRRATTDTAFNAAAFVERFWTDKLLNSSNLATPADALLEAVRKDPATAHEKYGHASGLGSTYYYFVTGKGRVVAMDKNSVSLSLNTGSTVESSVDVELETGNIFGNAIRDGTGLLNVSDFTNSQDFNGISSEINRRIEEQVLPGLRDKVTVGAVVRFTGCAEITDDSTDLRPLRVVPIAAVVQ